MGHQHVDRVAESFGEESKSSVKNKEHDDMIYDLQTQLLSLLEDNDESLEMTGGNKQGVNQRPSSMLVTGSNKMMAQCVDPSMLPIK